MIFSGEAFVSISSDKDITFLGTPPQKKRMFSLAFGELLYHKAKADWPSTEFITVFKDNLTTPIGTNSPVILYLIFFWIFFVENIMLTYFPIFTHSLFHATAWLLEEQFHRSMDDTEKRIHLCSRRRIACETNQPMLLAVLGNHHVHIFGRSAGNIVLWKRIYQHGISMIYKKVN